MFRRPEPVGALGKHAAEIAFLCKTERAWVRARFFSFRCEKPASVLSWIWKILGLGAKGLDVEELARRTTKEIRHMLFTLRPLVLES